MENEHYLFKDSIGTRIKIVYKGKATIIRETFLTSKEIEISDDYNRLIIRSKRGIGSMRRWRFVKQPTDVHEILTHIGISAEQAKINSEILKKVLECQTTKELVQKIKKTDIQEIMLLGTLNALFSAMYVF